MEFRPCPGSVHHGAREIDHLGLHSAPSSVIRWWGRSTAGRPRRDPSLDHLVGGREERFRHLDAQRLGDLEVDD
jgi:hypothetical protein